MRMKRLTIAFTLLTLCCFLLANIGFAAEPGYEITEVYQGVDITIDGVFDLAEWEDKWIEWMDPYDARYAFAMDGVPLQTWFIEFLDTTNDAEDVWQVCIDGDDSSSTAPDDQDNKIEIVGHETVTVYVGDGQGWVEMTTQPTVEWVDGLTTTSGRPVFESDHYFVELQVSKEELGAWGGSAPPHGLRVAMYDASNETQGWLAWPPESDPDNPDTWGRIASYAGSIPESFSLGVVALLSSVAVAIAIYSVRNRKKFPK